MGEVAGSQGGARTKAEATKVASQRSECRQTQTTNGEANGKGNGWGAKAFAAFPLLFLLEMIFSQPSGQRQRQEKMLSPFFFFAVQTRPPFEFEMCSPSSGVCF